MKICAEHWQAMRAAVKAHGLMPFVAKDGATAAAQMVKEVEAGASGKATFDPLMSIHWAVINNLGSYAGRAVSNDAAIDVMLGEGCPLCKMNKWHEDGCTGCAMPKVGGFDWMIERAAEDALASAREYGLVP